MDKRYVIDSNAVIDFLGGMCPPSGMDFLSRVIDQIPNVSVITKIEVLGFNTDSTTHQLLADFFEDVVVLDLDELVVNQTIQLRMTHKIKLPDAIIAATALVHQCELITRNTADFDKIPELTVINPHT